MTKPIWCEEFRIVLSEVECSEPALAGHRRFHAKILDTKNGSLFDDKTLTANLSEFKGCDVFTCHSAAFKSDEERVDALGETMKTVALAASLKVAQKF